MTGLAQTEVQSEFFGDAAAAGGGRQTYLQQQAAEKIAQHRLRRGLPHLAKQGTEAAAARSPKHRVAAAVAERFAHTPSYRAVLAEQARRAIEEAAAAAQVAVRNAEAVAAVQGELLGELELWADALELPAGSAEELAGPVGSDPSSVSAAGRPRPRPVAEVRSGLTVRLYEDLRQPLLSGAAAPAGRAAPSGGSRSRSDSGDIRNGIWSGMDADEADALDAEIAFRQAPVFEDLGPALELPLPLPANLLEFPRQLVATRKARPRLAEGPLRDESSSRRRQLRIFEVEPEQISTVPLAVPAAPGWTSIRLDPHPETHSAPAPESSSAPLLGAMHSPQTAPMALRTMAALVDSMLVAGAFLIFVATAAEICGQIPTGWLAGGAAALTALTLYVLYQGLFFTLSASTPGMRYARIDLCTLSDENPSRSAMRRRIGAKILAACPLGLGLLWTLLDDDGLGWHDRMSGMYPRAY